MLRSFSKLLLVLTLAGCGAGGMTHAIPHGGKADAVVRRPASTGATVTVAVNGSGYNYTSYAVNFGTKPTSTSDFLVCYVAAVQATGTLSFTGGAAWTIAGAVTSSEPMQQIVAYRQATAADVTGQTYTVTTTTAGNHTGWVCDIVAGGFTFDQIATASQDVINGSQTLGTLTPSAPGDVVLALLGIDGNASETFTTPSGYRVLSTSTSGPDTWNFAKIKAATDATVEQPAGTSAYTGAQPHALSAVVALKPVPTPTPAPPALVEAVSAHAGNQSTSATSVSCAYTAVPANGQYLLAYAGVDSGKAFATPAGWSLVGNLQVSGAQSLYVFEKIAAGESSATYTFAQTGSVDYMTVTCSRWNGVDPVSPRLLTSSVANTNSAASPQVGPTLTPGVPNTVAVGYWLTNDDARTITGHTAGWTQDASLTAIPGFYSMFEMQHVVATSGTAYAPSVSLSGHDLSAPTNLMVTLILNPVGGSAPPTPSPTPTPNCCFSHTEFPANFTAYSSSSPWNIPISNITSPILYPNSDSLVQSNMNATDGQQLRAADIDQNNGPAHDSLHPIYFASSSDPLVNLTCTTFCDPTGRPAQMRVPAQARPGNGADSHIAVVQPDGTEIDTWLTTWPAGNWTDVTISPSAPTSTMTAGTVNACGNFYTGLGFTAANVTASTVGDACLGGGQVRYNEAMSGTIHHALFLTFHCGDSGGAYVYPAHQAMDNKCGIASFPNGAHFWLDLTDAQVDALPLSGGTQNVVWQAAVLKALHHYGGYFLDSGTSGGSAGPPSIQLEDSGQFTSFGVTSPWQSFASQNGWGLQQFGTAQWWQFADPWTPLNTVGGWQAHLHIVDPCYAQGTC